MKKRALSHFIKCCGGFYMSTVIPLKDPAITLHSAIGSIRASQSVYRELHPASFAALTTTEKVRAFCKGKKHVRENCFLWLDTPDGSKWAAKNPEKAAKTRALQKRLGRGKGKRNKKPKDGSHKSDERLISDFEGSEGGVWIMEDHAFFSQGNSRNDDVVLDTGATNHIFHDKTLFSSFFSDKEVYQYCIR
ncbi:hypothetical protein K3495_g4836 [Podosphaera aphanis]|nr:hypothetical protein K3495_g4836 [Podosphaera aphanis]